MTRTMWIDGGREVDAEVNSGGEFGVIHRITVPSSREGGQPRSPCGSQQVPYAGRTSDIPNPQHLLLPLNDQHFRRKITL
jgi:hypothetical protein